MSEITPKTIVRKGIAENPTVHEPVIVAMPWWKMIGVRVLRVYLQSLLGFLSAAGLGAAQAVGVQMPVGNFGQLLLACASLAVAPAAMSLIQNSIEILGSIDVTRPGLRA